MIIKIIIGIGIYITFLILTCIFFKSATLIGNRFDEKKEAEEILKKLEKRSSK